MKEVLFYMEKKEKERVIIIGGRTEQGLQDAINEALDAHETATIEDVDLATLRAYVRWTEYFWVTDGSLRDEYALRGIRPKCGSCPYYEPPTDKRRRCGTCYLMTGVDPRDDVCDDFFDWLESGEIEWKGGKR